MAALPEQFGPFVISGTVGTGGMGAVYRARDLRLHRDVAIKVVLKAGAQAAHRFTSEAQAASALNHPNIVTVYDVGVHDDVPYIVSELVTARRCGACWRARRCRSARCSTSPSRWPRDSRPRMLRASCIATSNPKT